MILNNENVKLAREQSIYGYFHCNYFNILHSNVGYFSETH